MNRRFRDVLSEADNSGRMRSLPQSPVNTIVIAVAVIAWLLVVAVGVALCAVWLSI